jgi:hypothetical protein
VSCPTSGCGAGPTAFGDVDEQIPGIYSDGTYLYWGTKDTAYNLTRRRLDRTTQAEKFAMTAGPVTAMTNDGTYLYWLETNPTVGLGPHYLMKAPK